jgi:hypothetical protein
VLLLLLLLLYVVLVDLAALCSCHLGGEIGLRVGRRQVRLALLEVLNLASRVLRAHEAAVEASDFVALCCPSARPFDVEGGEWRAHFGGSVTVVELLECATNIRICAGHTSSACAEIVGKMEAHCRPILISLSMNTLLYRHVTVAEEPSM